MQQFNSKGEYEKWKSEHSMQIEEKIKQQTTIKNNSISTGAEAKGLAHKLATIGTIFQKIFIVGAFVLAISMAFNDSSYNYFILAILVGLIPATIAWKKGGDFLDWWAFGAVLFIIALPCSIIRKVDSAAIEKRQFSEGMKKCPYCSEMIKGDAKVCRYCSREINHKAV